jgi:hypothetical protein
MNISKSKRHSYVQMPLVCEIFIECWCPKQKEKKDLSIIFMQGCQHNCTIFYDVQNTNFNNTMPIDTCI